MSFNDLPLLASRAGQPFTQHANAAPVSILLGVISGAPGRRRFLRCAAPMPPAIARVFVVGRDQPDVDAADVLVVNVSEHVGAGASPTAHTTQTGSLSSAVKLWRFLSYAYERPYPYVCRADDDVFFVPSRLLDYVAAIDRRNRLHRQLQARLLAGVFEFYNFDATRLKSTGHGYGPGESGTLGLKLHACRPARDAACQGPFPFAKGPLLLMSRELVLAVARHRVFASLRDRMRHAPRNRVDDDVALGYVASWIENTTYLRLPREALADRPPAGGVVDVSRTLAIHKLPWECHARIMRATRVTTPLQGKVACRPVCRNCLVANASNACMIRLPPRDADRAALITCDAPFAKRVAPVSNATLRDACGASFDTPSLF